MKLNSFISISALIGLSITQLSFAQEKDYYNLCVAEHPAINNSVVMMCAEEAMDEYKKQIEQSLKKIKAQAEQQKQPQRYNDILKAHKAWQNYVALECKNAGDYIGSPMYGFCPMKAYQARALALKEYIN